MTGNTSQQRKQQTFVATGYTEPSLFLLHWAMVGSHRILFTQMELAKCIYGIFTELRIFIFGLLQNGINALLKIFLKL